MLNLNLCNSSTFKGVFWSGSDRLEPLHKDNARKPANARQHVGASGQLEAFYVNDSYYCYIVDHNPHLIEKYYTFNEWYGGQVVPKITDISQEQLNEILNKVRL